MPDFSGIYNIRGICELYLAIGVTSFRTILSPPEYYQYWEFAYFLPLYIVVPIFFLFFFKFQKNFLFFYKSQKRYTGRAPKDSRTAIFSRASLIGHHADPRGLLEFFVFSVYHIDRAMSMRDVHKIAI